jgi:hypothetical protein
MEAGCPSNILFCLIEWEHSQLEEKGCLGNALSFTAIIHMQPELRPGQLTVTVFFWAYRG